MTFVVEEMKYSELRRNLSEAGFDVRRVVAWAPSVDDKQLKQVRYNIVRQAGNFILISADDRGEFFVQMGPGADSKPLQFDTEEDACDWVWAELTRPKPPPRKLTRTPEQVEEQSRRLKADYARQVAEHEGPTASSHE